MICDRIVGDSNPNVTSKLTMTVFSDGWLRKLKLRHGIRSPRLHGEASSAGAAAVAERRAQLQKIAREYNNAAQPLALEEPNYRHEKDKKRITVAVTSKAYGSTKIPLLFVGTARQPRYFNERAAQQLGHQYHSTAKGWMTTLLFQQWVHDFNTAMQKERRNVLLLLDNTSCHRVEQLLSNARIQMLPPNTTAHLQLQDAGVIQSLRARIEATKTRQVAVKVNELLERAAEVGVEDMQAVTKPFFSVDVLEVMKWTEEA